MGSWRRASLFGCLVAGCAMDPVASPAAPAAPSEPPRPSPPVVETLDSETILERVGGPVAVAGLCEPSGAARDADGRVWVVDDDQPGALFAWEPGATVATPWPLSAPKGLDLKDPEGVSVAADGALWVTGSHSLSRKGKVGDRAAVLRAVVRDDALVVTGASDALRPGKDADELRPLLDAIAAACPACDLRSGDADPATLNIEGAALDPSGALLLGLRAPLVGERAVLVSVDPDAVLADAPLARAVRAAWAVDLGGRGVRDLARDPRGGWWILAGAAQDARTPGPALFSWQPGGAAALLGTVGMAGLDGTPEALVPTGPSEAWLLIDEGDRLKAGLRPGGPHAEGPPDDLSFTCGANRAAASASDWARALKVRWAPPGP